MLWQKLISMLIYVKSRTRILRKSEYYTRIAVATFCSARTAGIKIQSGDVTGWVSDDYLYFGEEAQKEAKEVGILTAYSETETLRVRKEASLDSGVLGLLAMGEAVEAIEEDGDWVSINYEGETGYVAAEYVKVEFDLDTAESVEAIQAREAAEKEAARAQAAAERSNT